MKKSILNTATCTLVTSIILLINNSYSTYLESIDMFSILADHKGDSDVFSGITILFNDSLDLFGYYKLELLLLVLSIGMIPLVIILLKNESTVKSIAKKLIIISAAITIISTLFSFIFYGQPLELNYTIYLVISFTLSFLYGIAVWMGIIGAIMLLRTKPQNLEV